jgi:hypothetical protein
MKNYEEKLLEKIKNDVKLELSINYSDNSTHILSTNQIYEIGQYGPITLVFKKNCRRKFFDIFTIY